MRIKDIVKVAPADHDTRNEADRIVLKIIQAIVFALVVTGAILLYHEGTW